MDINKPFKGKKIIFGMPKRYGIYKIFIKKFEELGFEVLDVTFDDEFFQYKNMMEKVSNFCAKLKGNKEYKQNLKFEHQKHNIIIPLQIISTKADFALIIRPDLYTEKILKNIKDKSLNMIAFQWDGLDVFPKVRKLIPLFDAFFVFDPSDLSEKNVKGITNPPLDFDNHKIKRYELDIYFLGIYVENRMEDVLDFTEKIKAITPNFLIEIYTANLSKVKPEYIKNKSLHFFTEKRSFEEVSQKSSASRILVDFVDLKHQGLSLRVFQALSNSQKLITNNKEIVKYEFYRQENILVYDKNTSLYELENFLKRDFQKLSPKMENKYSFENWFLNIINDSKKDEIVLPKKH